MKKLLVIAVVIVGPFLLPSSWQSPDEIKTGEATKRIALKRIVADYGGSVSIWGTHERKEYQRWMADPRLVDPQTTFMLKAEDGTISVVSKDRYLNTKLGDQLTVANWKDDPY